MRATGPALAALLSSSLAATASAALPPGALTPGERQSVHAREAAAHASAPGGDWTLPAFSPEQAPRDAAGSAALTPKPQLAYRVYGYLPYWSSIGTGFHWELVSDLVLFSSGLHEDGTLSAMTGWPFASLTQTAHAHGVKVHLCVTLFGGASISAFLSSPAAQRQAISTLVADAEQAHLDGLNFDLEFVQPADWDAFSAFVEAARAALRAKVPAGEVTIATPPSLGYHGYDFARLSRSLDRILVMNYDYHWRSAPTAGPVAPLRAGGFWGENVAGDVDAMLAVAPADSLVMGVPYYGYDWATASAAPGAATQGPGAAVLAKDLLALGPAEGRLWDSASQTPWLRRMEGSAQHQVWYDDAQSISLKYELLKSRKLAGAMIWALGYDSGREELWSAIRDELGMTGPSDGGTPGTDGGNHDGGSADGGGSDAGSHDGGSADGGSHDGGSVDGGSHDGGGHGDGGPGGGDDGGAADGGGGDATDGGTAQDAGQRDSDGGALGIPDAGSPGAADAGGPAQTPGQALSGGCASLPGGSLALTLAGVALAGLGRRRRRRASS